MPELNPVNYRKIARDFKGRIELMKKTPLEKLETIFLELWSLIKISQIL